MVAVGNTQMKVYHALLSSPGTRDLGPDYYERQRDVRRQIAHHVGKVGALGLEVALARLREPQPAGGQAPPDQPAPDPSRLRSAVPGRCRAPR